MWLRTILCLHNIIPAVANLGGHDQSMDDKSNCSCHGGLFGDCWGCAWSSWTPLLQIWNPWAHSFIRHTAELIEDIISAHGWVNGAGMELHTIYIGWHLLEGQYHTEWRPAKISFSATPWHSSDMTEKLYVHQQSSRCYQYPALKCLSLYLKCTHSLTQHTSTTFFKVRI
jgi:hypothetical protein